MIARRLAMRATPIARTIVTAAGNPSGIAATARDTAAMNISTTSPPFRYPTRKVIAERTMIAIKR